MFICTDTKGVISMNNVSLIGRLTAEPELKHTQSGTACTRFNIAVDRRVKQGEEKQTDFITIVAWQQRAEFICKYFSKGQRIALTGRIQTGSYTDKDGNKRYTFEVVADNVEFCESKTAQPQNQQSKAQTASADIFPGAAPDFADYDGTSDDLPF